MAYHERAVPGSPRPRIRIAPLILAEEDDYDLDLVGHDDGAEFGPDHNFRIVFQLGKSYYIYLYVVGMAPLGDPRAFHTFWIKDCAVVDVDMEEYGPPLRVNMERTELPVLYSRVKVVGLDFDVEKFDFTARSAAVKEAELVAGWMLRDGAGQGARLEYQNRRGWVLQAGGGQRVLTAEERVVFSQPVTPE